MDIERDLARIRLQEERLRFDSLELQRDGRTLQERFGLGSDFMAHGGSFPLPLGTTCIGAVTVSGPPQRENHSLVTQVLTFVLRPPVQDMLDIPRPKQG